ncbi:hypothetical protein HDU82_007566 [Entophlyctis luteolus]|nr:hypothetical protein HDU82_007566 [Entophlyctis luteolus]
MLFEAPSPTPAAAAVAVDVEVAAAVAAAGAVGAASAVAAPVPIPVSAPTPPVIDLSSPAATLSPPPPPSPVQSSHLPSGSSAALVINPALLARFIPTPSHYPSHPEQPWHTSWIDTDAMIGGCSAPSERKHWRALRDMNVGLVVNLTETPVSPPRRKHPKNSTAATTPAGISASGASVVSMTDDSEMLFGTAWDDIAPLAPVVDNCNRDDDDDDDDGAMSTTFCMKCDHAYETYESDLFADVVGSCDMAVLFLPIPDGSVPRFEQLEIFLREADATIKSGKRVMVHCQAGVGRTGTFLAVYLINKYQMDPLSAVTVLRRYRPQSLQFHSTDWQVDPFRLHPDPKAYNRNMVQERFVERWWYTMIKEKTRRASVSSVSGRLAAFESISIHNNSASDYSSSVRKNQDQLHDVKQKHSGRRRHPSTPVFATFAEYLVAASKQQQNRHILEDHLLQQQQQQSSRANLEDIEGVLHVPHGQSKQSSILSSSLNAISEYPTPPRTDFIPASIKRNREISDITLPESSYSALGTSPQPTDSLSNSFTESFAKLSSSSHPYSRRQTGAAATSLGSSPTGFGVGFGANGTSFTAVGSYQRKRHPKYSSTHCGVSQHPVNLVPKGSSFAISAVLLKIIDAQLDAKLGVFAMQQCMSLPLPGSSRKQHRSPSSSSSSSSSSTPTPPPVLGSSNHESDTQCVIAGVAGIPDTRAAALTLCYGCRGIVAVGPEKVALNSGSAAFAVWPRVVPFPCRADILAATATAHSADSRIAFGEGNGYASLIGDRMDVDESAPATAVAAELDGAVEALRLEEVQRKVVSLAVRNHAV